jgi:hypothetical protein
MSQKQIIKIDYEKRKELEKSSRSQQPSVISKSENNYASDSTETRHSKSENEENSIDSTSTRVYFPKSKLFV